MKIINKNYGSISHLSTSKLNQQADKKINQGQEKILTKQARDYKDLIIVTEKLDGSNVGVLKKNGILYFLTRSGYEAHTSQYEQHRLFPLWCHSNLSSFNWLPNGWRICGEWMIKPHGTKYDITELSPFVAFDIIDENNNRVLYINFLIMCASHNITTVKTLHIGQPISIKNSLKFLGSGHYGKPDKPEGVVYRCERNGHVDFLAKHVMADKEDGKYMNYNMWNKGWIIDSQ